MYILTIDNSSYSIDQIPNKSNDIRFCVFDCTVVESSDYIFIPLVFLESYTYDIAELKIGNYILHIPLNWHILVSDGTQRELEILPIEEISGRGFKAFAMNPMTGFMPYFLDVDVINICSDIHWFAPKLRHGHILSVPIENKKNPLCVYLVSDNSKLPETIDVSYML